VHSIDRTVESIVKHHTDAGSKLSQVDVDRLRNHLLSPQGALEHANAMASKEANIMASKKTIPVKTHDLQSATSGEYFMTMDAKGKRVYGRTGICYVDYAGMYSSKTRYEVAGNQITSFTESWLYIYDCSGTPFFSSPGETCTTPACALVNGIPDAPPGYRVT
jgi:hypothetical protein